MIILDKNLIIPSRHYQKILLALQIPGEYSRLVGGCVRDCLLKEALKNNMLGTQEREVSSSPDIDITTTLQPSQVIEILSQQKIKVVPTGLKFGGVTAFMGNESFEITTLRNDVACNGRHAEISFTKDFRADAGRRDFTINALSYCPFEQKIYDYFTGIEDLANSRVVFIGNPLDRITEDFLRILRFFRFSCYYARSLDSDGLKACINLRESLKNLSRERIKLEMDKLITANNSPKILEEMFKGDILQIIFPVQQFDPDNLSRANSYASMLKENLSNMAKYSILFSKKNNINMAQLLELKFSRQEAAKILDILNFLNELKNGNAVIFHLRNIWLRYKDFVDYLLAALALNQLQSDEALSFYHDYNTQERMQFPITGHDLMAKGLQGKLVGEYLVNLKKLWIESNFKLSKNELLQLIVP